MARAASWINLPTTWVVREATVGPLLGTTPVSGVATTMRSKGACRASAAT